MESLAGRAASSREGSLGVMHRSCELPIAVGTSHHVMQLFSDAGPRAPVYPFALRGGVLRQFRSIID
jgi:hypothetical protein